MLFTNTLALLMALAPATLFASPTPTSNALYNILTSRSIPAQALKALEDGVCDLSGIKMPIGKSIIPITSSSSYIPNTSYSTYTIAPSRHGL
jgi:hypothetical protein